MSGHSTYEPKTAFERWLDTRLPIIRFGVDYMMVPTVEVMKSLGDTTRTSKFIIEW